MVHRTNGLASPLTRLVATAFVAMALLLVPCGGARAEGGGFECVPTGEQPPYVAPEHGAPHIRSALLPLQIYLGRDSLGEGGASPAQVDSIVSRLIGDFANHDIHFLISYHELTNLLNTGLEFDVMGTTGYPEALCAYLAPGPESLDITHGQSQWIPGRRCSVIVKGSWDNSVLSHEIGHCLGLVHTFDEQPGCAHRLSDDCTACGDRVCDTAWNGLAEPMRDIVNRATCEYTIENPPIADPTNIMSYSWPTCLSVFTNGQVDRMLYFIENDEFLSAISKGPVARFDNKSDDTNLQYVGTPYSSVVLDYNADGKKDLFISMRDNYGSLQKKLSLTQSEVPLFQDRTEYDIEEASLPQIGLRGVAAADYDNDGRVDLFAAAESNPRLYHNNNGTFADSASALGLAAFADSSYAGAWGDFDRDGQIDLYVCRGAGGGSDPTAANLTAIRGKLLSNDVRASGSFVDRSDCLGAASNAMGASVAASWADAEGDGDLDLFVGDLRDDIGSASSRFYINNGAGGLTESFASSFSDTNLENVNSVVWADMNNDAKLDLVIGSESAPPTIYFNSGSANFYSEDPLSANLDAPTNGVRPVDFDLDGQQDLVAIPRSTSDHRWMFWSQVVGGNQTLLDQSYSVGFADSVGRVDGMTMADFNSDGDADMYFGRAEDTHDYFYRARSIAGDDPINDWVGVRLEAGGGNNRSAVGARVRFYVGSNVDSSYQQVQVVDGGSGKGGQADNVLICGLGARTGTVSAEVKWPGGFVQSATLTRGQVTTITDATSPGLPSTVSGVYTAIPGGEADLTFTWDTAYSCDPALDRVTLTDAANQPSQCVMGSVVLTPSSGGVTHTVFAKSGGGYRHTLTWLLECNAPCSYSYLVESATDSTHKDPTPTPKKITMNVCISQ